MCRGASCNVKKKEVEKPGEEKKSQFKAESVRSVRGNKLKIQQEKCKILF